MKVTEPTPPSRPVGEPEMGTTAPADTTNLYGLRGAASWYWVSCKTGPVVAVPAPGQSLASVSRCIQSFNPQRKVVTLPHLEGSPFAFTPLHDFVLKTRLNAWDAILNTGFDILVTHALAFLQPLPPRDRLIWPCVVLNKGDNSDPVSLGEQLVAMGYRHADLVTQVGDFARRGGIVDVYPMTQEDPIRIEFFDDEIEEMRRFDPDTQAGTEAVDCVRILPRREWCLTGQEHRAFSNKGGELWNRREARQHFLELLGRLGSLGNFPGMEHFVTLFFDAPCHLRDILPPNSTLFLEDTEQTQTLLEEHMEYLEREARQAQSSQLIFVEPASLLNLRSVSRALEPEHASVVQHHRWGAIPGAQDMATRSLPRFGQRFDMVMSHLTSLARSRAVVLFSTSSGPTLAWHNAIKEQNQTSTEVRFPLQEERIPAGFYHTQGSIPEGFDWPQQGLACVSDAEWFGDTTPPPRRKRKAFSVQAFDLKPDDLVVHVEHGIGRFVGLEEVFTQAGTHEMMALEYRHGDRLYLALNQLDKIERFGSDRASVSLDRLGGTTWARTQASVRRSVRKLAFDLVKLYAQRNLATGIVCGADTPWQEEFEQSFPFEPTEDQLQATREIKEHLQARQRPMDRLLVGDVGFGKTEVAWRMAFKVILEGSQVAFLCPTTVLAFQHFLTARERFQHFPVRIRWLSRLTKPKEKGVLLRELADGLVDLVIGTHRLLSQDVSFKNLGAIIVDEEQRFGVNHKERLKHYRKQAHILSMSATPIPRTLNMALSGLRDISLIETPPRNRLAISTTVTPYRDSLVKKAIEFELDRGGQVFFLHNRVETMPRIADLLQKLVPQARMGVAHGQLNAAALETVMMKFMTHELDLLIASTIIENGVDIPNANTMLINHAERFGLSQLYQLRGRIGRGHRPAYAYLLVPSRRHLTAEAQQRIAAMEEFSELGSGFRIAAMDMEIRGAGNLLGAEQAGHIQSVGFATYMRLLEEAVAEAKGEAREPVVRCNLNLKTHASIPKAYIPDTSQRMAFYKRMAAADEIPTLEALSRELADRYGPIPGQTLQLLQECHLRIKLTQRAVASVEREGKQLVLRMRSNPSLDLVKPWLQASDGFHVAADASLVHRLEDDNPDAAFHQLQDILNRVMASEARE